jgi:hypothetical protein
MTDSDPSDLNITDLESGAQFTVTGENLQDNHRLTGAVPIAELEALADEWEDNNNPAETTIERIMDDCAQELREVLAEYE